MSERKKRDLFDYLQWFFTLLIAAGGFYLNVKQNELANAQQDLKEQQAAIEVRSQRERMIQLFADKTFSYIDKMGIEDADKQDVLIELVDIITEINVSETGEVTEEEKKNYNEQKSLIPLRLALVTGNDDILAHITTSKEKRDLWIEFAVKSNNDIVRNTAIKALGQIFSRADELEKDERHPYDYKDAVKKIMAISSNLTDDVTRISAAEAIANIEQTIIRTEELPSIQESDDEELKALFLEAQNNLRSQEVENINRNVASDTMLASKPADGEARSATQNVLERTQATLQLFEPTGAVELIYQDQRPDALNEQTRKEIEGLIDDLFSDDTKKRQGARAALIEHGNKAVAPMLDAYMMSNEKDRYRAGLGVAYVLYKMKQPVRIPDNDEAVSELIRLIGASQSDIRRYASEFLMKLYDEQSVTVVYDGLKSIISTERKNGNLLYNSVVVLGTWMRILPSQFSSLRETIRNDLIDLKKKLEQNETEWTRTLMLIDEMLGQP